MICDSFPCYHFRMSYFFIDEFQGFLCEYFVRRTEELAKLDCNACKDKIKCHLLHMCIRNGMLEKITIYFEKVRGEMLACINVLFEQFCGSLQPNHGLEPEAFINCDKLLLFSMTPKALFYGRFVTELNAFLIGKAFIVKKK